MNKYIILISTIILIYLIYDYYTVPTILVNKHKLKFINFIKTLDQSSNKLFMVPYLELGDSIVSNGAIRYYSTIYDSVIIVCRKSYYNQISFMYNDSNNIIVYPILDKYIYKNINIYVPYDNDIKQLFSEYNIKYLSIGCFNVKYSKSDNYFPNRIYDELNLDLDIAYKYFKIYRDHKRENELYNKLINIIGNKYIILIDDEKRNFIIDDKYLMDLQFPIFKLSNNSSNKIKKLNTIKDDIIFNYIKILENAVEIISIDSSIPWLIDMLNIKTKTTIHKYLRLDNIKYNNKNISVLNGSFTERYLSYLNINNIINLSCYIKMI